MEAVHNFAGDILITEKILAEGFLWREHSTRPI
jgi:hypothetical protein